MATRRPAPSPDRWSAATAPRWRTRCSAARADSTIPRLARPPASATKPIPQASCSKRESYKPAYPNLRYPRYRLSLLHATDDCYKRMTQPRPIRTSGRAGPTPRRSGATDNRSAPASISPPPSPPWHSGIARREPLVDRHASRRDLICQTFGELVVFRAPNVWRPLTVAAIGCGALLPMQTASQAVNVGPGVERLGDGREGRRGGRPQRAPGADDRDPGGGCSGSGRALFDRVPRA
jgi:hypothetical protein